MKKILLFIVLALFCSVQMKADDIWTQEGCEGECASKLEVTPDKPYAEMWMKYFSEGKKYFRLYIRYINSNQPELNEAGYFTEIDKAYTNTAKHTVELLKCGVTAVFYEYNDNPNAKFEDKNMKFKFYVSHVPKEGKLEIYIQRTTPTQKDYYFEIVDGSNITVLDPILDAQPDFTDKNQHVGQQKCFISSLAEITDYRWTDSSNPNFIKNTGDNKNMLSVILPQTDRALTRTIELRTNYIPNGTFDQTKISNWNFTTTAEVKVKPFHRIFGTEPDMTSFVYEKYSDYNKDDIFTSEEEYKNGFCKCVSLVNENDEWLVYNPKNEYLDTSGAKGSPLFVLVGTPDKFRIYPYGYDQCLGLNGNGEDNWRIMLDRKYNEWKMNKNGRITIMCPDENEMKECTLSFHGTSKVTVFSNSSGCAYFSFRYYGTVHRNSSNAVSANLADDNIYTSEEDFKNGKRKYISLKLSHEDDVVIYNAANKSLYLDSDKNNTASLFTLVGNQDRFKIYPYGIDKTIGLDSSSIYNVTLSDTNNVWANYSGYIRNVSFDYSLAWGADQNNNNQIKLFYLNNSNPTKLFLALNYGLYPYQLMETKQNVTLGDDNLNSSKNIIEWGILSPEDEDVMDGDQFMLQRAFKPDFSDAQTIATYGLTDFLNVEQGIGMFKYEDADDVAKYNKNERWKYSQNGTLPKAYYRVMRSAVYGLWPQNMGEFQIVVPIELKAVIPNLTSLKVERSTNWDKNKSAMVTVEFANPIEGGVRKYVWDPNVDIKITRTGKYTDANQNYRQDEAVTKEITIKGTEVKWDDSKECFTATIEDGLAYPHTDYYYKAEVDTTNALYPTEKLTPKAIDKNSAHQLYFDTDDFIAKLDATRGTEMGKVIVTWESGEGLDGCYDVKREVYKNGSFVEKKTLAKSITARSYADDEVAPDSVYRYSVTAYVKFRGENKTDSKNIIGYSSPYGRIKGKIQLDNGAAMPAKLEVEARYKNAINISEVKIDSVLIRKRDITTEKPLTATCDSNGNFVIDNIVYQGFDTQLSVQVSSPTFTFLNSSDVKGPCDVTINSKQPVKDDIVFTNDDCCRIAGRVLYENSTVPVRDVSFRVLYDGSDTSWHTLKDAKGKDIVTNETGNFDFHVPQSAVHIQAFKEGHVMKGGGFIKDKNDSINLKLDKKGLAGLQLADSTKVRLVGRLCGGDREGDKALGFGLSKNNLGDNLTVVLQLEGDNTAQIVYHNDEPDNTTDSYFNIIGNDTTHYTFEKKRIVIHPNDRTGEFAVDLFPVKYKVTQLSAKGYSTLYSEGEGFQVLDLSTDSIARGQSFTHDGDTVRYNATFKKVYHAPVTVTYTQNYYNMDLEYIGEQKFKTQNFENEKINIPVVYKVKSQQPTVNGTNTEWKYTFGYPVFLQGKEYQLKAYAHEDYYYNGEESRKPDVVNIKAGSLVVGNGIASSTSERTLKLDSLGTATFTFTADNPEFALTGEDALRSIEMQVEVHGRYYNATPLRGYVLGSRDKGKDVQLTVPKDFTILDVIRDPMGSGSFAYREKGTKYTWSHEKDDESENSITIEGEVGGGSTFEVGLGWSLSSSFSATVPFSVYIPGKHTLTKTNSEYTMTLNERISTSDDPYSQGAQSDVYVGFRSGYVVTTREANTIVDDVSYGYMTKSIESGAVKLVGSGTDNDGKHFYIVTGDQVAIGEAITSTFAYTQKHILGVIIPELEKKRNAMLNVGMTEETAKKIANEIGKSVYISCEEGGSKFDPLSEDSLQYKVIFPQGNNVVAVNEIDTINNSIVGWRTMIYNEEERKLKAFQGEPVNTYDVAGSEVSHSEDATSYYSKLEDIKLHVSSPNWSVGAGEHKDGASHHNDPDAKGKNSKSAMAFAGFIFSFGFDYKSNSSVTEDYTYYKMETAGTGYTIKSDLNDYFTTEVYNTDYDVYDGGTFSGYDWANASGKVDEKLKDHKVQNFIFRTVGGAMRAPWFPADSTKVYVDPVTNKPVALGGQFKKIDNPKVYIDNPIVSNVPQNETATFSVRLTNESEIAETTRNLVPLTLVLRLADDCNPNGAKVYMDGMPITDGREFYINPGQSITKTIEVGRGAGYDFENLKLMFMDKTKTLVDYAAFSVHFLPEATPVNMTAPDNQWVMNTLSAKDDEGKYYLPVSINGFDKNSEDFHHIEFQYKKHTDGESQWVNLCSYYAKDDSIYQAASGNKALIEGGSIGNIRFYGEKDPVEMEYDLRAVSFRQWGTGFITKASNVVSGMKDTRPPVVFGMPKPINGILTDEDVISLPFNENIAYNYLDETANFQVMGYTNKSELDLSTSLRVNDDGYGITKVTRNLTRHDFTIDMMVKSDTITGDCWLMTVDTIGTNSMSFGIDDQKCLWVWMSGREYKSKPVDVDFSKTLTRVGMIYTANDSVVRFFCNELVLPKNEITVTNYYAQFPSYPDSLKGACNANGVITVGGHSRMNLREIRLWNKALTEHLVAETNGKRLTGKESGLLAYWPLDETQGNVAADKANGANLYLTNTIWSVENGQSLHLVGKSVELTKRDKFQRTMNDDYTLSFWFRADNLRADTTTIFRAGMPERAEKGQGKWHIAFENGILTGHTNGMAYQIGTLNYNEAINKVWHRMTISVSHSHNNAIFMVDGTLVDNEPADSIGGMASDMIQFGSENFEGYIDDITFWHVALPINYIKSTYNSSPSGREAELKVFLPFTMNERNDQNTIMQVFCPYNMVLNSEGKYSTEKMFEVNESLKGKDIQAPIHSKSGLENLPFTWACTDTELQINIDKTDKEINHQQITLTVRGVEDLRGNSLERPQMWTVYVDRNVLKWDEQTVNLDLKYGEGKTFKATWQNKSGRNAEYIIENNCNWLSIDKDRGAVEPIHKEEIEITITDGLAPGEYSTVLYLIDENQLSSPLEINVKVTADEPEWTVTTNSTFTHMMNVIGQLNVVEDGRQNTSTDKRDIIAAFYQDICVGKGNITVKDNQSYVYLNIVGCSEMQEKEIDFYVWRASTNQTSLLEVAANGNRGNAVVFINGSVVGSMAKDKAVQFRISDSRIQSIRLNEGWNWVSLNVKPNGNSVQNLFVSNNVFTAGDKFTTMDDGMVTYVNGQRGLSQWSANDGDIHLGKDKVYQIYMQHPGIAQVRGKIFSEKERYITLDRKGWNSLPYLLEEDLPINIALSDYLPVEGGKAGVESVIKSHNAFAIAYDGRWYGTLEYMHPGEGYYVNHSGDVPCEIHYTNTADYNRRTRAARHEDGGDEAYNVFGLMNSTQSEKISSMPVVAVPDELQSVNEDDEVIAVVNGEIVGHTNLREAQEGKKYFFITVNSEDGGAIRFALVRNGQIKGVTSKSLTYSSSGIAGSLENPYILTFDSDASALGAEFADGAYDLLGRKMNEEAVRLSNKNVFIINGKKVLKK